MHRLYYILIIVLIGFSMQKVNAQSAGYYGKKVFFTMGSEIAPSFSSYRQVKDGSSKRSPKIIYASFNGSVEAIISKRMTLNLRYTFDPIYNQTGGGNIELDEDEVYIGPNSVNPTTQSQAYILDDFWSYRHDIGLDFKLYLRDNIPAIGKFIKFGASYSLITTPDQSYNLYGNLSGSSELYNENKKELTVTGGKNMFHVIFLKFGYGQSFEIVRNLFFYYSLNVNLPLFDTNLGFGPADGYTGKNLFGRESSSGFNASKTSPTEYRISDSRYYNGISRSVLKQNFVMLELGFSFALF